MSSIERFSPVEHIPHNLQLTDQVLVDIADRFGTPLYVYDADMVAARWKLLADMLPDSVHKLYSVKANPNVSILQILRHMGALFEVASGGEFNACMAAGVQAHDLVFVGPAKSSDELQLAVQSQILCLVVESLGEMRRVRQMAEGRAGKVRIAVRVNPGAGRGRLAMGGETQFGMSRRDARLLVQEAADVEHIEVIGVHGYLGTGILDVDAVLENSRAVLDVADELQDATGAEFTFLDLGGGFGIPYHTRDVEPNWLGLRSRLDDMIDGYRKKYPKTDFVCVESGRFIVGPCGVLVCRVIDVKPVAEKVFVALDGGTNIYPGDQRHLGGRPPPLRILGSSTSPAITATICGPLCTPTDLLAQDIRIPQPSVGQLVGIYQAGAYGLTASPGLFLSHGFPSEVLVQRGEARLVRPRLMLPEWELLGQSSDGEANGAQGAQPNATESYPLADLERQKSAYTASHGQEPLDLSQGDPDLPTPEHIVEALCRSVREYGSHRYPPFAGHPALLEAICKWYLQRFGVQLDASTEALVLMGGKDGITHLPLALCKPGDAVVVPDPGYPAYASGAIAVGAEVCPLPGLARFDVLLDSISESTVDTRRVRLVYLNSPSNPTGEIASYDYLANVVRIARELGCIVCHDAVYSEHYYDRDRRPSSILEVPGALDVAVEVHSLSKMFSMQGWRIGMIVGNRTVIAALRRLKASLDSGVFVPVQVAAVAALQTGPEYMESLRSTYKHRRDVVVSALAQHSDWKVASPPGGMYVWAPVPEGFTSAEFVMRCLDEAGVLLAPGTAFGRSGAGYVRLSLNADVDRLRTASTMLGAIVAKLA